MATLKLNKVTHCSLHRKVCIGGWRKPEDPSIYSLVEIDMEPTLALLPKYESKYKVKIKLEHLVGKAVIFAISQVPEVNAIVRKGRLYQRQHIKLVYEYFIDRKADNSNDPLGVITYAFDECENLSLATLAKKVNQKYNDLMENKDQEVIQTIKPFKYIPWRLMRFYLNFISWLIYDLKFNLPFIKIPTDPFGSALVLHFDNIEIDNYMVALSGCTRIPLAFSVGSLQIKPVVVEGKILPRRVMVVAITMDHRIVNGIAPLQLVKHFKECFLDPERFLFDECFRGCLEIEKRLS